MIPAAVEDFADNADLLFVLLVGVGVVGVDDGGGIFQLPLFILLQQPHQILIVIVGHTGAVLVHTAPEDDVGQIVAVGGYVTAPINEGVGPLGGGDGVEHHGKVAAGGVFHAHGNIHAAGREPVLLIFHRAGANGLIGQDVVQIAAVFGVQHFVGGGEPRFRNGPQVHFPNGDNAAQQVGSLVRFRLVQHSLIALAGGAGLVGVNAGNQNQPVGDLLADFGQPGNVFAHGVLVVGGAGPHNHQKPVGFPGEYGADFLVPPGFDFRQLGRKGDFLFQPGRQG